MWSHIGVCKWKTSVRKFHIELMVKVIWDTDVTDARSVIVHSDAVLRPA
jgi:hypothetical protein